MRDWLNKTHVGDCRELLKEMKADGVRVQTCVTSPPYFGLRDYGHALQIGLESSPTEYVGQMLDVFRLVRDVLADDGTLWLNLGDSYVGGGGFSPNSPSNLAGSKQTTQRGAKAGGIRPTGTLKTKDLLGMPWRVAFALQRPYYLGRITSEIDRVWLAAMVDGEGCFYVHRRQSGGHAGDGYYRKTDTYSPALEVANTHKAIVDRCLEIAGIGSTICQEKGRRQPLWRWTVRASEAKEISRELYPYLVGKRQQCRIICGMPSNGERAIAAWEAMKILHAGGTTDVDYYPEPESLHQPGYYLRSDVIWAKPNPMPESVTDRPTKSHEYFFLLAKSDRYYFNAEAIAEPVSCLDEIRFAGTSPGLVSSASHSGSGESTRRFKRSGNKARVPAADRGVPTRDGVSGVAGDVASGVPWEGTTRNKRTVWTVTSEPFPGAHFATFPRALIEPCILAGARPGDTILDPFMGSGTTAQVATDLGRNFIGCELNPKYVELHEMRRTTIGMPL